MTPKFRRWKLVAVGVAALATGLVLWGCNDDPATPPPPRADLAVTKTVDVASAIEGERVTYTVTLRNNGPSAATAIQVTDLVPADLTLVTSTASSGSYAIATGIWSLSSLAANANATLTIAADVDPGTVGNMITNSATVTTSTPEDPTAGNNVASASLAVVVARADLAVTKTVDVASATEGGRITYTVTLSNAGPARARAVYVTDVLPAGLTLVTATPSSGSYSGGTGIWSLPSLDANASAILILAADVDVGTAGAVMTNTATITASAPEDPAGGNDTDSASMRVVQFGAGVQGSVVHLQWSSSTGADYRLIRTLNAPPSGPNDPQAAVVYTGTATQANDPLTGLLPAIDGTATVYYYALYDCAGGPCIALGSAVEVRPTLVQCLRVGGYTIFWRHADADSCADDLTDPNLPPNWWRSCDTNCTTTGHARQLNAVGIRNATHIGQQFDAKGIPIGRVLSSEFCRCFHTAELMDFGPVIEHVPAITFFVYDEPNRCANCQARIAAAPAAGTNTAIIGHAGYPTPPGCPILNFLAWSECAIYKPQPAAPAQLVRRVLVGEWAAMP